VVEVAVVVVVDAGAGEAAALVEAWTSKRLSLLVEGPAGRVGVVGLVLVSASGAMEAAGLELAAGSGELVCAFTAVRAKNAAPAQRKMLRRLGIDM
jgi:hypothetical protein